MNRDAGALNIWRWLRGSPFIGPDRGRHSVRRSTGGKVAISDEAGHICCEMDGCTLEEIKRGRHREQVIYPWVDSGNPTDSVLESGLHENGPEDVGSAAPGLATTDPERRTRP